MTKTPQNGNGWSQYQKLVIFRLEEIEKRLDANESKLQELDRHIIGLRWRAKATGAIFGGVAGVVPLLLSWAFRNG